MFRWFRKRGQSPRVPQWIVALSTDNLPEAHIVAGRLQHEGIQAWVFQEPGAQAWGITVGILGEIRVLVHEDDYEAALRILAEDAPLAELEPDNDDIRLIFPPNDDAPDQDQYDE